MDSNTKYHVALLLDDEPTLVAVSYYPRTRVERITGVDVSEGTYRAVLVMQAAGLNAVQADRDVSEWARIWWRSRKNPDYVEQVR